MRNGNKTMPSFKHLISNKALRMLEPVDIREHSRICAPVVVVFALIFTVLLLMLNYSQEAKGLYVCK